MLQKISSRQSKLSSISIFYWIFKSIAIILGITPQSRRKRRIATKRCNRRANVALLKKHSNKQKWSQGNKERNTPSKMDLDTICRLSQIPILNNNNSRSLGNLPYGNINGSNVLESDPRRILCILMENDKMNEYLESLSIKDSQIIDLQKLVKLIQSTTTTISHQDASTMTNSDHLICCIDFMTQSENTRRLKALEFIRIFLEKKNKEDFCHHLLHEEHLCQQKTVIIYQMINQFLTTIYQSKHEQN